MSDAPWVPFYTRDLLATLIDMSADAQHVFLTALLLIYDNDGPIENDLAKLCHRTHRSYADVTKAFDELRGKNKLIVKDNKISSRRAEKEIQLRQDKFAKASERGRRGAEAMWEKQRKGRKSDPHLDQAHESKEHASSMQIQNQNQTYNQNYNHSLYEPAASQEAEDKQSLVGEAEGSGAQSKPSVTAALKKKVPLPPNFELDEPRKQMARDAGVKQLDEMQDKFNHFVSNARSKGLRMEDWDEAWKSWLYRSHHFKDANKRRYSSGL